MLSKNRRPMKYFQKCVLTYIEQYNLLRNQQFYKTKINTMCSISSFLRHCSFFYMHYIPKFNIIVLMYFAKIVVTGIQNMLLFNAISLVYWPRRLRNQQFYNKNEYQCSISCFLWYGCFICACIQTSETEGRIECVSQWIN